VPLPSSGPQGKVYKAGGGNEITPLNMLALSADHLDALDGIVLERIRAAVATRQAQCAARTPPHPGAPPRTHNRGPRRTAEDTCRALTRVQASQIEPTLDGVFWHESACLNEYDPASNPIRALGKRSTVASAAQFTNFQLRAPAYSPLVIRNPVVSFNRGIIG